MVNLSSVKLDFLFFGDCNCGFLCPENCQESIRFSKDNFLPFLIAVLLWCNIVVVLWYKLNKESFSFDIFIEFAPAFISYF